MLVTVGMLLLSGGRQEEIVLTKLARLFLDARIVRLQLVIECVVDCDVIIRYGRALHTVEFKLGSITSDT